MPDNRYSTQQPLKISVLLIIFNRLEETNQVFKMIQKAKPPRLYVAADGPREKYPTDEAKVRETRDYVLNNINWDCEVKTLFSEYNLGCRYGPISAINWFFENEERGIVLEDDCLPSLSFFWYCEELLEKHQNDNKVFGIGGELKLNEVKLCQNQYGFVGYPLAWGWASWRRAWQHFNDIPRDCQQLNRFFPEKRQRATLKFWVARCNELKKSEVNWWDYQFGLAMIYNQALWAFPPVNLVSNIGFGLNATHTKNHADPAAFRATGEVVLPLKKNNKLMINKEYNNILDSLFLKETLYKRLNRKASKLFTMLRCF